MNYKPIAKIVLMVVLCCGVGAAMAVSGLGHLCRLSQCRILGTQPSLETIEVIAFRVSKTFRRTANTPFPSVFAAELGGGDVEDFAVFGDGTAGDGAHAGGG